MILITQQLYGVFYCFYQVGTVIVAAWNDLPPEVSLRTLLTGTATTLSSQFRLTYNMILNLLRANDLSVEDMIKRSFSEFHMQRAISVNDISKRLVKCERSLKTLQEKKQGLLEDLDSASSTANAIDPVDARNVLMSIEDLYSSLVSSEQSLFTLLEGVLARKGINELRSLLSPGRFILYHKPSTAGADVCFGVLLSDTSGYAVYSPETKDTGADKSALGIGGGSALSALRASMGMGDVEPGPCKASELRVWVLSLSSSLPGHNQQILSMNHHNNSTADKNSSNYAVESVLLSEMCLIFGARMGSTSCVLSKFRQEEPVSSSSSFSDGSVAKKIDDSLGNLKLLGGGGKLLVPSLRGGEAMMKGSGLGGSNSKDQKKQNKQTDSSADPTHKELFKGIHEQFVAILASGMIVDDGDGSGVSGIADICSECKIRDLDFVEESQLWSAAARNVISSECILLLLLLLYCYH